MNDVSVNQSPLGRLRGVPATVVGGYLGSGKTTLINGWLRDGACQGWALLVNDLGSINVDAERLRQAGGRGSSSRPLLPRAWSWTCRPSPLWACWLRSARQC